MTIFDRRIPSDSSLRLVWPLFLLLLFLVLGYAVKHTKLFDALNQTTLSFFMARHHQAADIFFIAITLLCEPPYYYVLGGALLTWLVLYRHWAVIGYVAVALEGVYQLSPFLKHVFVVARPSAEIVNIGYAFPSGHTFLVCVGVGFLSLVLTQHLRGNKKYLALLLYNFPAILVGISRLYLGVHWLTDVIGGALIAWAVNLTIFFIYKRYSTYNVKPNKNLLMLFTFAIIVFCYLVSLHLEEQLYLYRYIANHSMTWQ